MVSSWSSAVHRLKRYISTRYITGSCTTRLVYVTLVLSRSGQNCYCVILEPQACTPNAGNGSNFDK